jgi:hypothetical protein
VPGTYECTFTASVNRECPPSPINIGPETASPIVLDLAIHNGGSDLDHGDEDPGCHQGSAVSEEDEESVGAYVLVNWDDDDGDGSMNADGTWAFDPVPDLTETYVRNEDNLAKLLPTLSPLPDDGIVELEVVSGAAKVMLWSGCWKQTELQAGSAVKSWDLSDAAQRAEFQQFGLDGIWLEGIDASDAERDVELELRYLPPNGQTCSDTVRATVVMINLANAVHREGTMIGVAARGHAALVWKFIGPLNRQNLLDDNKFLLIHMSGPTDTDTLGVMTQSPGEQPWGCFTNPQITYVDRLKILMTAKTLMAWHTSISWTGYDALLPDDWNGRLDTIRQLRCDGLVEVCYEIGGVEVWGMLRRPDGVVPLVHHDISEIGDVWIYDEKTWEVGVNQKLDNLEEHNDFDYGDFSQTLMPATQCGQTMPVNAATLFQRDDLCQPVGSKGGNP